MKFYGIKAEIGRRMKSTSGGVFQLLALSFLKDGGAVFGAGFDENLSVRYRKVLSEEELPAILGSKYVEASCAGTFDEVVSCLSEGKKVLFIGSPCIVSALRSFVSSKGDGLSDSLFLIDFICSGVPEKGFWEAYVKFLERKLKEHHRADRLKITDFKFRDKARPDSAHTVSWEYDLYFDETGAVEHKRGECGFMDDRYCRLFSKTVSLQERCSRCSWCNLDRPGDISIGDYWGVEKFHPSFDDGYGVSLCITNTGRGDSMVESILQDSDFIELAEGEIMQPRLVSPNRRTILNTFFKKDLLAKGRAEDCDVEMILKKYGA